MNRMCLLLIALLLIGCGTRAEVAKKKLLAKIDAVLGEMDVKREQIRQSVGVLKDGIDGIGKAKIKAKVKSDQIGWMADPIDHRIAAIDVTLKRLRDHLKSNMSVKIAGKTYAPAELKVMADKVIQARADLVNQQDGYKEAQKTLVKVVASLDRKQTEYRQQLTRLEARIAEIDAKQVALKAMKEASAQLGDGDDSLSDKLAKLEEDVNDLYAHVEAELRFEDSKWSEMATNTKIDSVDAFVAATQDPKDTIAEINRILGKQK